MRYWVKGNLIRSENAAKPHTQKSKAVHEYLLQRGKFQSALDFGCGKLRYSEALTRIAKSVTFVDSIVQLEREQVVRGNKTSVSKYVTDKYPNSKTLATEKISTHNEKYDLITCINVLSAIPCENTLNSSMSSIKNLLNANGIAVFINQHKSSYFKKFQNGDAHLNGFIHKGRRGISYYGIFDKSTTESILKSKGFNVIKSWNVGESNFVEACLHNPQSGKLSHLDG